ncbi:MAG: PDZ domain-containing protein [Sphingomonadaceae bacterium]|nr:PDZ domain-containing protein [Sphingomonadaceae bacterium]
MLRLTLLAAGLLLGTTALVSAQPADKPTILTQPALSRDLIAFASAGDIWIVPRAGGAATRLTTGVGVESSPVFSPDGRTIAFAGEYDGNTDVFTIPVSGGAPKRVTWHPGADVPVAWSADGKRIIFRSGRAASSRYTQLFSAPVDGGFAEALPLPMAFGGSLAPGGGTIAYNPLPPAFNYDFTSFVSWGNYKGGRAGTIWLTKLNGLQSEKVPHQDAADFAPVWAGGKVYFLSGRDGPISVYSYDPATKAVARVYRNPGPSDIRTLSSDGETLVFDRLGELYSLTPGSQPQRIPVSIAGDMPDVRARIIPAADQVETVRISPTGLRAVVEAHGEILTLPAKDGVIRNLTNSAGVMERQPAWSPDGQLIAYFSDERGAYALHVAAQTGGAPVRRFKLADEPAYYRNAMWSPDSKRIAFEDNRLNRWVADLTTGQVRRVGEPDAFGGFSRRSSGMAWSPDSQWLAFARIGGNHLASLHLWSAASGLTTQLTDSMANAMAPAFDRNGKWLYFLASNNAGPTGFGLDMTSDLYRPNYSVYALSLASGTPSPIAPELNDEKSAAGAAAKAAEAVDKTPAGQARARASAKTAQTGAAVKPAKPAATRVDLEGLSVDAIARRMVPLPLPAAGYRDLQTGKPGTLYLLRDNDAQDIDSDDPPAAALIKWSVDDKKTETLADKVQDFELSADGAKVLVAYPPAGGPAQPGQRRTPTYAIADAAKPIRPGDPEARLDLSKLSVRTDPALEWPQMYREVWRIERSFFYDPKYHGYDTLTAEKRLAPYVAAAQSRSDLNYVFQEMLTGFSVGHLRGGGGAIPNARRVPGGLLGADYTIRNGRWCIVKVFDGGSWSPDAKAPLAQPGLDVHVGDCILAINGMEVRADMDIQQPLEGTAGQAVMLRLQPAAGGAPRDVTVVPVPTETRLRYLDWIEGNRHKVAELSGGKLAYVHLPDTGAGGFTNFNRFYFAQTDKRGAIVDERFNAGGQAADYIIEVLGRRPISYWQARYGGIDRTPYGSIIGPKVMLANEISGSGGDMLPWMFKAAKLGPLVGKRTWGGLVGIGPIPPLMDGGSVTSPSVGFFNPAGQWEVENHGVAPDYEVEQDPALVAQGRDPQLETAVRLALDALAKESEPSPKAPSFPVYSTTAGESGQ